MKSRKMLSLLLMLALMLAMLPVQTAFATDTDRIHLSNVWLEIGSSGNLAPEITGDGTVFTFNDTKGEDIEDYLSRLSGSKIVNFQFVADVAQFLYYETGTFWDYGNKSGGVELSFMDMKPYATDPNYVIFSFTLRERPSGNKATLFTIRIKKWESQYQPEIKSTWFNTLMFIGIRQYGTTWSSITELRSSNFMPVKGQSNLFEYTARNNVTTPYDLDIQATPHYLTTAYIDGVLFIGSDFQRRLTFTEDKQYYDFKIDPGTIFDDKHTKYAVTTWRLRVVPATPTKPLVAPTKDQFTYSLTSRTFNSKAQGVSVVPKSGVGKVTAVYYNKSTTAPTKAGSYAVTVDVAVGTNYTAVKGLSLGTFKINKADLSKVNATVADMAWTGKQIKPTKIIYSGVSPANSADVTVKSYGANKNIGKGTIKLTGKGNFTGSKTVTFKIVPKKNSVAKITVGANQMNVTWSKVSAAQKITKYEARYRVKGTATWKTEGYDASLSSATINGLTTGMAYEVQTRSFKTVSGVKYYSAWSATKTSGKIK